MGCSFSNSYFFLDAVNPSSAMNDGNNPQGSQMKTLPLLTDIDMLAVETLQTTIDNFTF